jgi:hypothetical protein
LDWIIWMIGFLHVNHVTEVQRTSPERLGRICLSSSATKKDAWNALWQDLAENGARTVDLGNQDKGS